MELWNWLKSNNNIILCVANLLANTYLFYKKLFISNLETHADLKIQTDLKVVNLACVYKIISVRATSNRSETAHVKDF